MSDTEGTKPGRRRVPRWLFWPGIVVVGLLALVVIALVALELVGSRYLRPIVEEQVSAAIPGNVSIAGMDVTVVGVGVDFEGVAIRAADPEQPPPIEIGRLVIRLARWPLLQGRVVVSEIALIDPVVRVVHRESGEWSVMEALVEAAPPEPEKPEEGPPPDIRLEEISLEGGRIEFHDLARQGAEPIVIEIPSASIGNVTLPGQESESPTTFELRAAAEGATLEVAGDLSLRDPLVIEARLDADDLPVQRARVYLPELGWTELSGRLDAELGYEQRDGEYQRVSGTIGLDDLKVGVPALEEPALSLASLRLPVEELELVQGRLALGEVALEGLRLYYDPADRAALPLLPRGLPGRGGAEAEPQDAGEAEAEEEEEEEIAQAEDALPPAEEEIVEEGEDLAKAGEEIAEEVAESVPEQTAPPSEFQWSLAGLSVEDSQLVPVAGGSGEIGLRITTGALASTGDEAAPVTLALQHGDGALVLDGRARVAPPAFEGKLSLQDLALPPLQQALGLREIPPLAAGQARGEITLALGGLGEDAAAAARDLRAKGHLEIEGLEIPPAEGLDLSAKLGRLGLALDSVRLPGVLPAAAPAEGADAGTLTAQGRLVLSAVSLRAGEDDAFSVSFDTLDVGIEEIEAPALGEGATPQPIQVSLSEVKLVAPDVRLTRTEKGLVLPGGKAEVAGGKRAEAPPARSDPPAALELVLDRVQLDGGELRLRDRTVKPFFQGDATSIQLSARDVRWPATRAEDVSLRMTLAGAEEAWVYADWKPDAKWYELQLTKLPLAPFNPYARSFSSYQIEGGQLTLYSKGSETGPQIYLQNDISLLDLQVSGGGPDSWFEQNIGVPIGLALSLLKGPTGDINLSVPIDVSEGGTSVRLGSVIANAFSRVLLSALTSPLKLLGAVVLPDGRVKQIQPEPIPFQPGGVALAEGAEEKVATLAKLMAARPDLRVQLSGQTAEQDAEMLRKRRLLEALESGENLPPSAEGLTLFPARRRIRNALEQSPADAAAALDVADQQRLAAWMASMEVGPADLQQLGADRATRVRELLQEDYGVDASHLVMAPPGPPGGSPMPAVDFSPAS